MLLAPVLFVMVRFLWAVVVPTVKFVPPVLKSSLPSPLITVMPPVRVLVLAAKLTELPPLPLLIVIGPANSRHTVRFEIVRAVLIGDLHRAADGRHIPVSPEANEAPADAVRDRHISGDLLCAAADFGVIVAVPICDGQAGDFDIPRARAGMTGEIPGPVDVQGVVARPAEECDSAGQGGIGHGDRVVAQAHDQLDAGDAVERAPGERGPVSPLLAITVMLFARPRRG